MLDISIYNRDYLREKIPNIIQLAQKSKSVENFKKDLTQYTLQLEFHAFDEEFNFKEGSIIRVRDAARTIYKMLLDRSESKANFSVAQAIIDISKNISRPDLTPAFYAELIYLFSGLEGRGPGSEVADIHLFPISNKGREAAIQRSDQLDLLSEAVNLRMDRYVSGLEPAAVERREKRRHTIINYFQASPSDWNNWQWQIDNIFRDPDKIADLTTLSNNEKEAIDAAKTAGIPFGVTPHYLSLMDDEPNSGRDLSIRAQVFPTTHYVETLTDPLQKENCFDFMKEEDTSPIDLITRRYPAICIFKPFNTCPQICVYCQRNWEIEDAMAPDALASEKQLNTALEWIKSHPSIYEVLITGGDPLAMADKDIDRIIHGVSQIPTVERIRIGTRVPVTVPMRINNDLTDIIKKYQIPGKRQIAVVTHIQHAYEITPDTLKAINKIREKGISVYNQLVFTFYNSRRFEAAHLRKVLTMIGVDPYYTFNTKGKEETNEYRVPLARLLQEQKEEARLLPGISRTDEAVYNVPSLGKNYLRARQHRDLISILPDGSRLYEFHPWEKNISNFAKTYIGQDIPILEYLKRLDEMGENVAEYETIWYYY